MSKKGSEKSPFSTLHHVTIAVKDMEKAVKYYESVGIGPFKSFPPLRDFFKYIVKEAQIGPVSLQLVQPPSDEESMYGEFLKQRGEGVQHLGFVVDDIDAAEATLRKLGLRVTETGRRADGSGFTYFDTDAIGGVTLEIRQNPSQKEK
jgi:catechol 2,3-dioxygenase-like lactoylglutathione lyase family enzyme